MAKRKGNSPKRAKPTTDLLARSVDELLAEVDEVMNRARGVQGTLGSGRTSRSVSELSAEHRELLQRVSELHSAIDCKRSKTFRPRAGTAKRDV